MAVDLIIPAIIRLRWDWSRHIELVQVLSQPEDRVTFEVNCDHRRAVVKVDTGFNRAQGEREGLRVLAKAGMPVPGILYEDQGPPSILVTEWIEGVPLTPRSQYSAWTDAGRLIRQIHDVKPPEGYRAFDWRENGWRQFVIWWAGVEASLAASEGWMPARLAGKLESQIMRTFETMPEPSRVLLHGDCHDAHFLLTENQSSVAGIIDLGDTGTGDPLWDLATLTLWAPNMTPALLEGYLPDEGLWRGGDAALAAYRILRHLGAVHWLIENQIGAASHLAILNREALTGL